MFKEWAIVIVALSPSVRTPGCFTTNKISQQTLTGPFDERPFFSWEIPQTAPAADGSLHGSPTVSSLLAAPCTSRAANAKQASLRRSGESLFRMPVRFPLPY
ncbi:hypothetical protein J31TS4_07860 [Paenibacillus sp. J31TS4]|nr:hypothetical protein J31TS4_07860 [Paenibacillus sp. J31TS4]